MANDYPGWSVDDLLHGEWFVRIAQSDPVRAARMRRGWRRQEAARARLDAHLEDAKADAAAMLYCTMRHPLVRGLDTELYRKRCFLCAAPLPGRRQRWCSDACVSLWHRNHQWSWASEARLKRDGRACVRCGSKRSPEVNHKHPRLGRGYHAGCFNHQNLLETLCHACHVVETNRQAAERKVST